MAQTKTKIMNYQPVIGLEVHVELKTKSKMFCRCSADYFGKKPNSYTCPVCLGMPGALPVPNKTAIEWCIKIALALNCNIPLHSKFDRKNYFYPDLPKGYQISQYDEPFAIDGSLELKTKDQKLKTIRIRRVHMEEDTGKLTHADVNGERASLIDFNRSSVPLVEIVTEPDFENAEQVVIYLKKLQQIVRYLDVSNADMEKGDMRLEPNISLRPVGTSTLPSYKVEVKNINSFRFVEKSIEYEIKRQAEILDTDQIPAQETRGWEEVRQKTVSQRSKEEAQDYRYFPEPDIPPFNWKQEYIDTLKEGMPELPDEKLERFQKDYALSYYDAEILTREKEMADFFEEAVKVGKEHNISAKQIANHIINKKVDIKEAFPAQLVKTIVESSKVEIVDEQELNEIISQVLLDNQQAVLDYKGGKYEVLGFLIGMTRRKLGMQNIDTNILKNLITNRLNK